MKNREQLNWLQKMWFDCATNPTDGTYSLGRLQPIWATFMVTFLSLLFVIDLHIYPEQSFSLKPPPLELIYAWGAVALGLIAAFVKDKANARNLIEKIMQKPEEPEEDGQDFNRTN